MRIKELLIAILFISILCNICYAKIYVGEVICIGNNCHYTYDMENKTGGYVGVFNNLTEADKWVDEQIDEWEIKGDHNDTI